MNIYIVRPADRVDESVSAFKKAGINAQALSFADIVISDTPPPKSDYDAIIAASPRAVEYCIRHSLDHPLYCAGTQTADFAKKADLNVRAAGKDGLEDIFYDIQAQHILFLHGSVTRYDAPYLQEKLQTRITDIISHTLIPFEDVQVDICYPSIMVLYSGQGAAWLVKHAKAQEMHAVCLSKRIAHTLPDQYLSRWGSACVQESDMIAYIKQNFIAEIGR